MSAPVRPSREDPLVRWASAVVGGASGLRLRVPAHHWWNAARVLVLVGSVAVGLAVLRAQHCRVQGWTSPGQFVHACYSDVAVLHATVGGSASAMLGLDPAFPDGAGQPVLSTLLLGAIAVLAGAIQPLAGMFATVPVDPVAAVDPVPRAAFDLYAVVAVALVALLVVAVVGCAGRRPWDAALVAFSPVLVLAALIDVDLLGVALGACAAWAWARHRPVAAGVLLGVAVAARFHLVLLGVALVLLALREPDRRRGTAAALTAAVAAWAVLNLPFAVLAPTAWSAPSRTWWTSGPSYGSLLHVPSLLGDEGLPVAALSALSSSIVVLVLTAAVVVAVGAWVLGARRTPPLAVVVLLLLVGSLLAAKAVPVQASLWLLPWAALAVPSWREHACWWAAEALYTVAIWQFLVSTAEPDRALPAGWLVAFVVLRLSAVAWLGWTAARRGPVPDGPSVVPVGGAPDLVGRGWSDR